MKKGIVVLFVVLALVVLVSPGLVGWLAERSVEEQMEWASEDSGDSVIVSAEWFERGWLSSEGRHRIELRDTPNVAAAKLWLGVPSDDALPALIVDTRIDHGIIPVGSLTREESSLSPGLGSAVSTLSLETANGEIIELPGKLYSEIALDGDLNSNYKLDAGSNDDLEWGAADIEFVADAADRNVQFEGFLEGITSRAPDASISLQGFEISGEQTQTNVGIPVGNVALALETVHVDLGGGAPIRLEPVRFESNTDIDDGRLNSDAAISLVVNGIPQMDGVGFDMLASISGADAAALGRLQAAADALPPSGPDEAALNTIESAAKDLLAAGLSVDFERFDISGPQGDISAVMHVDVSETDRSSFEWTSLLLALNGNARVEVSESIVMMGMMLGGPQAEQLQQFLVKDGDKYEIEAAYDRGVMTVNGVPLTMPVQ